MCPANPKSKPIILALGLFCASVFAGPGDAEVERFLRDHRMDQLLEVQLENRLREADDQAEREEIASALSELYLNQLRALGREDPYREIVLFRARSLVERTPGVPMHELRLELLVDQYITHENAIELAHLRLLDDQARVVALDAMRDTQRGLARLLAGASQDLDRLNRRRTSTRSLEAQTRLENDLDALRRLNSFGNYYLGWSGYGVAVLEGRHVEIATYEAFGWLLGADGSIPKSENLPQTALEYEHVARAVIGIAMCEMQSEELMLSRVWLESLLDFDSLPANVPSDARRRLLRVRTMNADWSPALELAIEIISDLGDGYLTIADARFVAITTLESRRFNASEHASRLVTLCIEQLVAQREIGHVVDLYTRFQNLPQIGSGFIPAYAVALAELDRLESGDGTPSYADVIVRFHAAVKAPDADNYPEHRDDCRLKLAYTLVRADKPKDAIEQCQRVLDTSLDAESLEEARWVRIAALDHTNALAGKRGSSELEDAIRSYIEQYPGTQRARTLVLRYAMQGVLDPALAIETLSAVPDSDPNAQAARRLRAQLQYEILRKSGFSDPDMLRDTRELIARILNADSDDESIATRVASMQIGIDLAIRDTPSDTRTALRYIEDARSLIGSGPLNDQLEPELLTQLIRVKLDGLRIEEALAHLDELRAIDAGRADDARVLVLNSVIDAWESNPDITIAAHLVSIGAPVIARVTPPEPERFGVQHSALIEVVAHAASFMADETDDQDMLALALRLSKQVLAYGQGSEPGLRRTASIAFRANDAQTALDAWLRLLAAYPQGDDRWYEARYESLAIMKQLDAPRAYDTFKQFRTLNPTLGPAPWNEKIAELFDEPPPTQSTGGTP